jgi:hypothetical protein
MGNCVGLCRFLTQPSNHNQSNKKKAPDQNLVGRFLFIDGRRPESNKLFKGLISIGLKIS